MPLKVTPVAPVKLLPVITTLAPASAEVGEKVAIVGAAPTVTKKPVVDVNVPPVAATTIAPEVAPTGTVAVIVVSFTTVKALAAKPLNVTPVAPVNPVPVIVTVAPSVPNNGLKELSDEAGAAASVICALEVAAPSGVTT